MAFSVVQQLGINITSDTISLCFGTDVGADDDTGVNATAGNSILVVTMISNSVSITDVSDNVDTTSYTLLESIALTGDRTQYWHLYNNITGGATTVDVDLSASNNSRVFIFEISSDNNDLQVEATDEIAITSSSDTHSTTTGITTDQATLVFTGNATENNHTTNTVPTGFTASNPTHAGNRLWIAYKDESSNLTNQTYTWDPDSNDTGTVMVIALRDGADTGGGASLLLADSNHGGF